MAILTAKSNVFEPQRGIHVDLASGSTLKEYYDLLDWPETVRHLVVAVIDGVIQKEPQWDQPVVEGEQVTFLAIPAGGGGSGGDSGKQAMMLIASIAITVLSSGAGSALAFSNSGTAIALEGALGLGASAPAVYGAAIGMVANLAMAAIFAPSTPDSDGGHSDSDLAMITGQSNQAKPYGVVPKIFGNHRVTPHLGAAPYVDKVCRTQSLYAIYSFGYSGITIYKDTIEIGGVSLATLQQDAGYFFEERTYPDPARGLGPFSHFSQLQLYQTDQFVRDISYRFDPLTGAVQTTVAGEPGSNKIFLDFLLPGGLYKQKPDGEVQYAEVSFGIQYRFNGVGDFADVGPALHFNCNPETGLPDGKIITQDTTEQLSERLKKYVSGPLTGGKISVELRENPDILPGSDFTSTNTTHTVESWPDNGGPIPYDNNNGAVTKLKQAVREGDGGENSLIYQVFESVHPRFSAITENGYFKAGTYTVSLRYFSPVNCSKGGMSLWATKEGSFEPTGDGNYKLCGTGEFVYGRGAIYTKTISCTIPGNTYKDIAFMFYWARGEVNASDKAIVWVDDLYITASDVEANVSGDTIFELYTQQGSGKVPFVGERVEFTEDDRCVVGDDGWPVCTPGYDDAFGTVTKMTFLESNVEKKLDIYEMSLTDFDGHIDLHSGYHWTVRRDIGSGILIEAKFTSPFNVSCWVGVDHLNGGRVSADDFIEIQISSQYSSGSLVNDDTILTTMRSQHYYEDAVQVPEVAGDSSDNALAYSLMEVRIEATNALGATMKPLTVEVFDNQRINYDLAINNPITGLPGTLRNVGYRNPAQSFEAATGANPAWAYINVLLGNANKKALIDFNDPNTRLQDVVDIDTIARWAAFCDEQVTFKRENSPSESYAHRFEFHHIVDYTSTIQSLLDKICSTGRAVRTKRDGKHSVIFDGDPFNFDGSELLTDQLITPDNSWGLTSSISYVEIPDALNVDYLNTLTGKMERVVVYNDGVDLTSRDLKYEDLTLVGTNSEQQAWRHGRYYFAESKLRRERLSLYMDVENIVLEEGQLASIAHDVIKAGGVPARILAISGTDVTLDEVLPVKGGLGVQNRRSSKSDTVGRRGYVSNPVSISVYSANPSIIVVHGDVSGWEVGDLLVWGELDQLTEVYQLVTKIPGSNLTARMNFLEYDPGVLLADTYGSIPDRDVVGGDLDTGNGYVKPIAGLSVWIDYTWRGDHWEAQFKADWLPSSGITGYGGAYRVSYNMRPGSIVREQSDYEGHTFPVDGAIGARHRACVVAVDVHGNESLSQCKDVYVECPDLPPGVVTDLSSNANNGKISLYWGIAHGPSVVGYVIKYRIPADGETPADVATNFQWALQDVIPGDSNGFFPKGVHKTTVDLFPDTNGIVFAVKAVTACGAESSAPTFTLLDYQLVPGLPAPAAVTMWPDPGVGAFSGTENDGAGNLRLLYDHVANTYQSEGWYLFSGNEDATPKIGMVDINGAITYTKEQTNLLMKDMIPLAVAVPLSGVPDLEKGIGYGAEVYRWTDPILDPDVTGNLIDLLNPSNDIHRNLVAGVRVESSKIFFGIRLFSVDEQLSPEVSAASYHITYPEVFYSNQDVPIVVAAPGTTDTRIDFTCSFYQAPTIDVTGEDFEQGTIWEVTHVDIDHFILRTISPVIQTASIDWSATGFGKFC